MGDGVNIAARLEGVAEPGGICMSHAAYEQVRDKVKEPFRDLGGKELKNIRRRVRTYSLVLDQSRLTLDARVPKTVEAWLALPDKPSIAVLPFVNMSSDSEQQHFADGLSEDIITALSRIHSLVPRIIGQRNRV